MQETRKPLVHPSYIVMTLVLAGVSALFLGFSASYLYNRFTVGLEPIAVPILFYVNTLILIGSSYTLIQAKKSYLADNTENYKTYLIWQPTSISSQPST